MENEVLKLHKEVADLKVIVGNISMKLLETQAQLVGRDLEDHKREQAAAEAALSTAPGAPTPQ